MHNQPSVTELIQAVKNFVDQTAAPNLSGHAAFHARVASNTLSIILRDIESRTQNDITERESLQLLLGSDGSLDELNETLCAKIQTGEMNLETPGLLRHLKQTAMAQVEVDQPRYSGLKAAKQSI